MAHPFRAARLAIALLCAPLAAFTCHGHGTLSVNLVPSRASEPPSIDVLHSEYKRTLKVVDAWAKKHNLAGGVGYYSVETTSCGLIECRTSTLDVTVAPGPNFQSARISFTELGRFPRSSKSVELERDLIQMLSAELGYQSVH